MKTHIEGAGRFIDGGLECGMVYDDMTSIINLQGGIL